LSARRPLDLTRCHECDLEQRLPTLAPRHAAHCPRCGVCLARKSAQSTEPALALGLAALILWLVANGVPFMDFSYEGRSQSNTIVAGAVALMRGLYWPLGALILATSVLAPVGYLGCVLALLVPLRFGRRPPGLVPLMRILASIRRWAMLEIYLVGALVALVKLSQLASIELREGAFCFAGLILCWTALVAVLDPQEVWSRAEGAG